MLTTSRIAHLATAATLALAAPATASASGPTICGDMGGEWDGQYCHTTVTSERNAVRDIKIAVPADLIDNQTAGPAIRDYFKTLFVAWKDNGQHMIQDSWGEENYQVFHHGTTLTAVFHEDYHANGPQFNNAYRTFTFDMVQGERLQLSDLTNPGIDPLTAIPPLAQPFIEEALNQAAPQHDPGSYPFVIDRWTPNNPYSGGYKAWALTADELILYMPDYPVAHDVPINYDRRVMQWSMDGGTVEAHIPLSALRPVLKAQYS